MVILPRYKWPYRKIDPKKMPTPAQLRALCEAEWNSRGTALAGGYVGWGITTDGALAVRYHRGVSIRVRKLKNNTGDLTKFC